MIFDLHNDLLTAKTAHEINADAVHYADCNVKGVAFAVWTSELKPDTHKFSECIKQLPKLPYRSMIAVEDLGSLNITDYESFFCEFKPAYVSLTWNGKNKLAGGVGCEEGLSIRGKDALTKMAKFNVPVDLAHLSDTAFYEVAERADNKFLVTHTASRDICGHSRNLTDEMAKIIAERDGIIGVAVVSDFLAEGCASRKDYLRHLLHFTEVVGARHVAIGTDFNGTIHYPIGLSGYEDFAILAEDMKKSGFNDTETEYIFHKNAERFFGGI